MKNLIKIFIRNFLKRLQRLYDFSVFPLIVAIIGTLFTGFIAWKSGEWLSKAEKEQFVNICDQITLLVHKKLESNVQLLLSAAAFVEASENITFKEKQETIKEKEDRIEEYKRRLTLEKIDDIYIPKKLLEDKDILQLLIIPQFKTIKNNTNITQEMIVELLDSGYVLSQLPSKFFKNTDFIKQCLKYEDNYHFFDDYNFIEVIEKNPQLKETKSERLKRKI